jgi:hypothetical protein
MLPFIQQCVTPVSASHFLPGKTARLLAGAGKVQAKFLISAYFTTRRPAAADQRTEERDEWRRT